MSLSLSVRDWLYQLFSNMSKVHFHQRIHQCRRHYFLHWSSVAGSRDFVLHTPWSHNVLVKLIATARPCGHVAMRLRVMDKAPDIGSGDCRFKSSHGRQFLKCRNLFVWLCSSTSKFSLTNSQVNWSNIDALDNHLPFNSLLVSLGFSIIPSAILTTK